MLTCPLLVVMPHAGVGPMRVVKAPSSKTALLAGNARTISCMPRPPALPLLLLSPQANLPRELKGHSHQRRPERRGRDGMCLPPPLSSRQKIAAGCGSMLFGRLIYHLAYRLPEGMGKKSNGHSNLLKRLQCANTTPSLVLFTLH